VSSRLIAPVALAAALVVAVVLAISSIGGDDEHMLRASFDSVVQLAPGQEVRIAGRKVGEIGKIDLSDGHAVAELKIREGDVWPLPRGTTAGARWGSTTSLAYRYVEIHPGPTSAPDLPDGGVLSTRDTKSAMELDSSYRIFRGRTRGDLRHLVSEAGDTLDDQGPALRAGLKNAPGGLDATAELLRQFGADRQALRTLVLSGASATNALAARESDISGLVENAASTFDEFARHTRAEQVSLERAPGAFRESTTTLRRLDGSLTGLQALLTDLAPGAKALRTMAEPARAAFAELRDVVPLAGRALRSGSKAAPGLTRLLTEGKPFLDNLGNVLGQVNPMFACLRPYAPELAGNMATWAGYNKNYDRGGHYARTFPLQFNSMLIPGIPLNSKQITDAMKGRLNYAMPRPPGLNAGKPWFQPQCGAGPESLDASKDPEGAGK
jgi:virulence factor Mce-like protein